MKKTCLLLAIAVCSSMTSIAANAATGTFGYCNNAGFVTRNSGPLIPGSINTTSYANNSTSSGGFALVLIDGLYCAILGTTPGETALIRSVAQQAYHANLKFTMGFNPVNGNVDAFTSTP